MEAGGFTARGEGKGMDMRKNSGKSSSGLGPGWPGWGRRSLEKGEVEDSRTPTTTTINRDRPGGLGSLNAARLWASHQNQRLPSSHAWTDWGHHPISQSRKVASLSQYPGLGSGRELMQSPWGSRDSQPKGPEDGRGLGTYSSGSGLALVSAISGKEVLLRTL